MRRKWINLGLVCVFSINVLSGCQKKDVNYNVDGDTQRETAAEGRIGGVEQFADMPRWEEAFETVITKQGDIKTVDINAEISVPDTKKMSVAEVREAVFDEGYIEKMAKQIFGDGEIYYNDVAHLPEKELKAWYDYYVENELGDYDAHLEEKIAAYQKAVANPKDTYTPVKDFTVNEYLGKIEGVTYELTFTERDNLNDPYRPVPHRTKEISLVPKEEEEEQLCPKAFAGTKHISYMPQYPSELSYVTDNYCELTEEEAKQKAEDFIDMLGLEYPVFAYREPLAWSGEFGPDIQTLPAEYGVAVNGYVFYYDYGIDGVSVVASGEEESYVNLYVKKKDSEEIQYSMKARIRLFVTERGVIRMDAYNPIETTDMSAAVGLLPFQTIQDIMRDQLLNHIRKLRFYYYQNKKNVSFDEMALIYFRVRDKENQGTYSYVPAWRLGDRQSGSDSNMINVENPLLINALDGSWINLYEEM